jgi:hypothetical protein
MDEYREIVNLRPVLLDKASLAELERVLCKDLTPQPDSIRIQLDDGARVVKADSIEQLFRSQLPTSTDSLSIDIVSWNQQSTIDAGISLHLYRNFANYQLHALSETLYLGKKAQLDGFFRKHRPWYAIINKLLPNVGAALSLSALFAAALLARQGATAAATLSAALAVASAVTVGLAINGRIFPYVRVRLADRKSGHSPWEVLTLLLGVMLLIATIVSILLPLARATPK